MKAHKLAGWVFIALGLAITAGFAYLVLGPNRTSYLKGNTLGLVTTAAIFVISASIILGWHLLGPSTDSYYYITVAYSAAQGSRVFSRILKNLTPMEWVQQQHLEAATDETGYTPYFFLLYSSPLPASEVDKFPKQMIEDINSTKY